jgi:hypothetical protein
MKRGAGCGELTGSKESTPSGAKQVAEKGESPEGSEKNHPSAAKADLV